MACENCVDINERTAKNGWVYDERFGTKIEICKYPVPTFSINTA